MTENNTMLQITLRDALVTYFNESELQDLYFQLGVDYGITNGLSKPDKARELVLFLSRRDRLPNLVDLLKKERPRILEIVSIDQNEDFDSVLRHFRESLQENQVSNAPGSVNISIGDNASGVIAGQDIHVNVDASSQKLNAE